MFRTVIAIAILFVSCLPSLAQGENPSRLLDKDALRTAIYAGDIAYVEEQLAEVQDRFLTGEATADDVRIVYQIFTTTHPAVIDFTELWLQERPNSVFAHTAQAWIYHTVSWNFRGDKLAFQTYPAAMQEFRRLQDLAWDHAEQAHQDSPNFIPASDALLRMATQTGQKTEGHRVLSFVMTATPNMGTLRRGIDMTHPGWGGSWLEAEWVCNTYAGMIDWKTQDPKIYCLAYAAAGVHFDTHADWGQDQIAAGLTPGLEDMLLARATWHTATRADAEFARDFLNRPGVTNYFYARRYDDNIAMKYGFEFISHHHHLRQQGFARQALEHDPYNPDLIKLLLKDVAQWSRGADGKPSLRIISKLSREDQIDLSQRLLISAPYDPENWFSFLGRVGRGLRPETFQAYERFWINAVVVSNHSPQSLSQYLGTKAEAYMSLDLAERGQLDARWDAVVNRKNWSNDIVCPIVRAHRLRALVCETTENSDCVSSPQFEGFYAQIKAQAQRDGICFAERTEPAHRLFFTPAFMTPSDFDPLSPG